MSGDIAYVVGFWFTSSRERVLLMRKARPEWMIGKWNGIGGKIEKGESPLAAMERECFEETGFDGRGQWKPFAGIKGHGFSLNCFRTFTNSIVFSQNIPDEPLEVHSVLSLPTVVPNVRWLIPMALSFEFGEKARSFFISEDHAGFISRESLVPHD